MPTPALTMHGITKRFGNALALDQVDFDLQPGEIHALLGENGAGKSTLMNILRGPLAPTAGQITLGGQLVQFRSPEDAARAGIGMVHQHFLLVPTFTVAENLALASRWKQPPIREAAELCQRLNWQIPFNARIADLPVGTQQRVEILKALLANAQILLFDEPTAVLASQEAEELFVVLRALRAEGKSLVFVSHKLNEVMALCDRVTVLRRGRNVGTVAITETDPADLARRMVGEEGGTLSKPSAPTRFGRGGAERAGAGSPILSLTNLATSAEKDAIALRDITFTLEAGETLGFAGIDGNGQAELAAALTGLRPWRTGSVTLNGQVLKRLSPRDLERLGIAFIPPDRHTEGLALTLSVADNLTLEATSLPRFHQGPLGWFLDRRGLDAFAGQLVRDFDIRVTDLMLPTRSLSGGNQQKIVIARALWRKPALLVAVSPTRGLDVAATTYVHGKLRERQAEGGAMILISTELDEVIALSTRIAVLYEGRIVGIVPPETPRETLGLMMGGKTASAGGAIA